MNIQMKREIELATNPRVGVNLYLALKGENGEVEIKRADLKEGETQNHLKQQFTETLRAEFLGSENVDDNLQIMELSVADERKEVLYHYDLKEIPQNLKYFFEFDNQREYSTFSFEEDDLIKVDAYLIVIGTQEHYCVLYKKFYPVFLLGRGSFCLIPSKQRFEEFDKELLRINSDYQFVRVGNEIYIKDLKVLEKFGCFRNIIEKEAAAALETIEALQILEESEGLKESLLEDISFARKLCKVKKTSPVLELNIPNNAIIEFTKQHPGLSGKLRYSEDGQKILLTTRKSQKLFLSLLDDSFLVSQLTNAYYSSLAKEKVEQ